MPVIAVAAAGFGAFELAAGALTVMETIAAIGAVTAGIGVVTGEQDLVKIGGVMGLVGGAGALADRAGMLSSSTELADSAAAADWADSASASSTANPVAEAAKAVVDNGAAESAVQSADAIKAPVDATPSANSNSLLDRNPFGDAPSAPAGSSVLPPDAADYKGPGSSFVNPGEVADPVTAAQNSYWGSAKPSQSFAEMLLDKGKGIMGWAKDNQMLSYGMMQVGGQFVSGLFDTTKEAQKQALLARAGADTAASGLLNQQAANMSAPLPTATSSGPRPPSVFNPGAAPAYTPPKVPGLINITGRPA